jgi:hypothetical protein
VLVTELITGARFQAVKARDEATRDRFGEIVFRFYFGLVQYMRRVSGDPHPGNYLLLDDGRVGFLDFGLMRVIDSDYLRREGAVAVAVDAGDAEAVHASLSDLGYLPEPDTFDPDELMAQIARWAPGTSSPASAVSRPPGVAELLDSTGGPRSPVVLPDAAPVAAAAGAADAPHGRTRALHAGRGPRLRRLARDGARVLRRRTALDAAGASPSRRFWSGLQAAA